MTAMVRIGEIRVDQTLREFVEREALPGTGISADHFWSGLSDLIHRFGPRNRELLQVRETLQQHIDAFHRDHPGTPDPDAYRTLLGEIGYLVPAGEPFTIDTAGVDREIALVAGPQLVVPALNARYALNAANARWGSLYDALYGTDAMGLEPPEPGPYSPERGQLVINWAKAFLDDVVALAGASHTQVTRYAVADGELVAHLADDSSTALVDPAQFAGHTGDAASPTIVVLGNNGLGIEIIIDRSHAIGAGDPAGVCDVHLEAAVTAIIDCEDSVAAVDAQDKVGVYRNWLGLMTGGLTETVSKGGRTFERSLAADHVFTGADGSTVVAPGRALMLTRNVGLLMTTAAVLDRDGHEAFEGLLDALVTVLAAMHDLNRDAGIRNSRTGSVYVVKPKLHGPDEAAFVDDVFTQVETMLGLAPNTVKVGLMDEERRTTLNLGECIRALRSRVAFINTGFLDRTGDEIHTSMLAGPMVRKADMRTQPWITAYEKSNVEVGLACGLSGRAQIGKGMWAAPDRMHDMLDQKIGHPRSGANCAWVPSPTAATLHATHYHHVNVQAVQEGLLLQLQDDVHTDRMPDLLTIPVTANTWSADERQAEIDNNAQGILGYVVRWIDQGIGCSKVPDLNDVALMEDRATCRISSQHIANWLLHGVVAADEVDASMRKMAAMVDAQNADDALYVPMAPGFEGLAFRAARDLVFLGTTQPSGYTEPSLHAHRIEHKRLAVQESAS
ncbi:unannotated protein [freshwater metagenome]|uniref:Unannotated protein n=1 Tax=freshwater metagenome TaxID=449393 RepID=A0A6J7F339_9ZZZZ|nr:malate synthase G [Actinomycetota bacterium]